MEPYIPIGLPERPEFPRSPDRPPTAVESLWDLVDATTKVTSLRGSLRGTIDGAPDFQSTSGSPTEDEVWSSMKTLEQVVVQPMQAVCDFYAQQARRNSGDGQTNTRAEYTLVGYALRVRTLAGELNMLGKSIDEVCRGNEAAADVRDEYEANMPKEIPNENTLGNPFPDGVVDDPTEDQFRILYRLLTYAGNSIVLLYRLLLGFVEHLDKKYGPGCITHWQGGDLVNEIHTSPHSYAGYRETTMTEPWVPVGLDYEDYPENGQVEETNTGSGPYDEDFVHVGRRNRRSGPEDEDYQHVRSVEETNTGSGPYDDDFVHVGRRNRHSGLDDEDYPQIGRVEETNTGSGPDDEYYVHAGRPIDADSGRDDEGYPRISRIEETSTDNIRDDEYYERIGFDTGRGLDDEDRAHIRRRNRRREEVYEHARRVEETWFEWR